MSPTPIIPPAPVGQQGPPTRVAAFDSWRSLRAARGPLLLATRTGYVGARPRTPTAQTLENLGASVANLIHNMIT